MFTQLNLFVLSCNVKKFHCLTYAIHSHNLNNHLRSNPLLAIIYISLTLFLSSDELMPKNLNLKKCQKDNDIRHYILKSMTKMHFISYWPYIFFTQEPELELPAQAQVSLTSHNINFFLSVCEFNVYSWNYFFLIIKKISHSYFCLYRY